MSGDALDPQQRFGLRLAGVNLLTPVDRPAHFIALAAIYPLPLAPRRVRGLTQLQGHPVTVLEASASAPTLLPALQRHAVLVVGDPAEAPMAFLVDEAPRGVLIGAKRPGRAPRRPSLKQCAFADLLRDPCFEADDEGGEPWWQADFPQLFELLIRDGEREASSSDPGSTSGDEAGAEPGARGADQAGQDAGVVDDVTGPAGASGATDPAAPSDGLPGARQGRGAAGRPGAPVSRPGRGQAAGRRREGRRGRKREVDGE